MQLTSRERVLMSLSHREPDRVPFDLGGSEVSGIHTNAYAALRTRLGLPTRERRVIDVIQNGAIVDDDVRDLLRVDVGFVVPPAPPAVPFSEDDEYYYLRDRYGIIRWMPKDGGLYYDIFKSPLDGEVSLDEIDRYPLPDAGNPLRLEGVREQCMRIREVEKRAVVVWAFGTGPFALAGWLRGIENFLMDLVLEPERACRMMDRIVAMKLAFLEQLLEQCGDVVDVICDGDDLGTQESLLLSPDTYRRLVKPRHRELYQFIHDRTAAKVFLHSDGAIRPLIPDLIDVGVDIINPVQVSAAGMDSAGLKRDFGSEICFWGGGIDTQHVLNVATSAEVRAEVRRRVDDFKPGGGFVFAAVHNIQANVPMENVLAMWEALQEYGVY